MIHKVGRYLSALLLISQSAHQAQKYLRENHSPPGTLPPASVGCASNETKESEIQGQSDLYTISGRQANYVIGSAAYNIYIYVTVLICLNYGKFSY